MPSTDSRMPLVRRNLSLAAMAAALMLVGCSPARQAAPAAPQAGAQGSAQADAADGARPVAAPADRRAGAAGAGAGAGAGTHASAEAGTGAGASAEAAARPTAVSPPAKAASRSPTVGGDGSQIQLDALTPADLQQAALQGELACAFTHAGSATPLLFAMGIVGASEPSQGVVKVSGYVERIGAPGGFSALLKGATFSGKGKTILIALTGPAADKSESPPRPATLTYQRADGASRTFEGMWQCGP